MQSPFLILQSQFYLHVEFYFSTPKHSLFRQFMHALHAYMYGYSITI